ncbi:MAG: hypothetical protein CL424_09575 [Acidimicrobiaceae bacterium]|nr:hypothetical protein [Acidimicrobiaceae bacterium]
MVAFTLCRNIARSSWGRSLRAIETSEIMASQVGVNVSHRKLAVTVLAAVYGGGAGILYLLIYGHLQPESFTLFLGVNLLVAVILGGSGSLLGPVVGAAAVALLSDSAILDELVAAQQRALSETWYLSGEGLVALIMLVVLLVLPRGIWGTIHHRAVSRRRARRAHTHVEPNEPAASALQSGDPTSEDASTPAPTPTAVLAVSGFGKSFGGNRAVDAMDLTVRAGEVHAVIGPNGAGKSTLANLISGLYHSDSGSAVLQGHEIRSLAPHEISRLGVGRTFQTPLLDLERSCSENVLLGSTITGSSSLWRSALRLPATIRRERSETERARELLRLVGLGAASDTPAGDLSYGQQRSLEIARALAGSPALVIMDEPGAGLNPHERGVLADLITAIADSGTAVVLVEHHMDLVRSVASRVTCMAEGTTLASGSVDSVLADPAVIESYLGASRTEPSSSPDDVATGQLEDGHV